MNHFSISPQLPLTPPSLIDTDERALIVEFYQEEPLSVPQFNLAHSTLLPTESITRPLYRSLKPQDEVPVFSSPAFLSLVIPQRPQEHPVQVVAAAPYIADTENFDTTPKGQKLFMSFGRIFRRMLSELTNRSLLTEDEPINVQAVLSPLDQPNGFPLLRAGFDILSTLTTPRASLEGLSHDPNIQIGDFAVWSSHSSSWIRPSDLKSLPPIDDLYLTIKKLAIRTDSKHKPYLAAKIETASFLASLGSATTDDERYHLADSLAVSDKPHHLRQALSLVNQISENYHEILFVSALKKKIEQELSWLSSGDT